MGEKHNISGAPLAGNGTNAVVRWLVVLAATLVFFYGMDQLLMSVQGLPLNWNMSPGN